MYGSLDGPRRQPFQRKGAGNVGRRDEQDDLYELQAMGWRV
jgi:hypothetical protein